MDRRKVLKIGVGLTAGAAMGGVTGCAPGAQEIRKGRHPDNMDDYLANLDRQLEKVRNSRFVEGFVSQATKVKPTPDLRKILESSETDFQDMLHTLLLTQSFRDLSEESQFHPGMQKKLIENLESIDTTVLKVSETLEKLGPEQRESVRQSLKKHPGLAMHLAETLDDQAAQVGVSRGRRAQLRSMMTQASFRLGNNDPGVVIDEYVEKVRRAAEPSRADIASAQTITAVGGEAFWRYRDQLAAANLNGANQSGSGSGSDAGTYVPGTKPVRVGAKLLGIGVLTFGGSAILVSLGAVIFVVGMTVGAILFAVGFITLIIGALIKASNP